MSLGNEFLQALLQDQDLQVLQRAGDIRHLFQPGEAEGYEFVRGFVRDHGRLPTEDTFLRHVDQELEPAPEPASYYLEHLVNRYISRELHNITDDASEHLRADVNDPEAALSVLMEGVHEIQSGSSLGSVHDFREAGDTILAAHAQARRHERRGVLTGWEPMDENGGWVRPGEMFSLAARPGSGKSWLLSYMAWHAWRVQHLTPLIVTVEMSTDIMNARLASIDARVPFDLLQKGQLSDKELKRFRKHLERVEESPCWVVDGSKAMTVEEIVGRVIEHRPDAVYVDAAYLLRHSDDRLSKNRKVAAVCDQLKFDVAVRQDVPVACTWQLNRDATDTRKGKPGLENISNADEIGQNSSQVAALATEDDHAEEAHARTVSWWKNRHGREFPFQIAWNRRDMDFSALPIAEDDEDLEVD